MRYLLYGTIIYLVLINIVAIFITVADKQKAKHNRWRIKEADLLLVSALGGAVGMYITMRIIHHKTRKAKFMAGIPIIFFTELIVVVSVLLWASRI